MRARTETARLYVACAVAILALPAMAEAQVFVKTNFLGVGIDTPTAPLHAVSTTPGNQVMLRLENDGAPFAIYQDNNIGISWGLQPTGGGNFTITRLGTGGPELLVKKTGDLVVKGSCSCGSLIPLPDFVFEADYELMPLVELAKFVAAEKHLPNVPSKSEIERAGRVNLSQMQMRLLEKIEELVLYTLDQQLAIDALTRENRDLSRRLARLESG